MVGGPLRSPTISWLTKTQAFPLHRGESHLGRCDSPGSFPCQAFRVNMILLKYFFRWRRLSAQADKRPKASSPRFQSVGLPDAAKSI